MSYEIFLAIGMFTAIVLALVVIILAARARLVSSGDVSIEINGVTKNFGDFVARGFASHRYCTPIRLEMTARGSIGQRSRNRRRVNRVDADVPADEIECRCLGQPAQSPFASCVGRVIVGDEPRSRGDVYDRTAARIPDERRKSLDAEEGAGEGRARLGQAAG